AAEPLSETQSETICGRSAAKVPELLAQIQAEKLPLDSQNDKLSVYAENEGMVMWYFTRTGVVGHPAVMCRQVVQADKNVDIKTQIKCDGSKQDCDTVARNFMRLNEAANQQIKSHLK